MVAKGGHRLLLDPAVAALRDRLLPLAAVVTPNRAEAAALAGIGVDTPDDAREAARRLAGFGARTVVVKGGHFEGPTLINLLFDGTDFLEFATPRLASSHTHGTGCTFASAVAAHLAMGCSVADAVDRATQYVAGAIANAPRIGHGHGPVGHFWNTESGI
jgi:hydroxymethylpyrimidine/phosphomethylpyrimidine kinase